MRQIDMLWEFQRCELELDAEKGNLEKYETKENLKQINDKYNRIREKYNNNLLEVEKYKKLHIRYNGDLKHLELNLKEERDKLYSGKVNSSKEYQRIEGTISNIKKNIDQKENEILKVIDIMEGLDKEIKEQKSKLTKLKKHFEDQKANHSQNIEKTKKRISELEKNIEELSIKIDSNIMDKYSKIKERRYMVMSGIYHGTCTGCNMDVSTSTIQNIKLAKVLVTCDNCGRILYAKV